MVALAASRRLRLPETPGREAAPRGSIPQEAEWGSKYDRGDSIKAGMLSQSGLAYRAVTLTGLENTQRVQRIIPLRPGCRRKTSVR